MTQKNIRMVASQFFEHNSGPGTFVDYLKKAVIEKKIAIDFIVNERDSSFLNKPHYEVILPRRILKYFKGGWTIEFFLFALLAAQKKYSCYKSTWIIDPIYAFFFLMHKEFRKSSVVMINDDNYIKANKVRPRKLHQWVKNIFFRILRKIEFHALSQADKVVVNSQYLKQIVLKEYRLDEKKVFLLYKAVDLTAFSSKQNCNERKEAFSIGFAKSDWERGGLIRLIKIANDLSESISIELKIAGVNQSQEKTVLRKVGLTLSGNLTIKFLGNVPRKEMPNFFHSIDAYCLLSQKEALGVSILEALASRVPCIGSNVGGIPEVLDYGNAGHLVESDTQIKGALKKIINREKLIFEKIDYGEKFVENFNIDKMLKNIQKISYDE